jgi:hypothetical protein
VAARGRRVHAAPGADRRRGPAQADRLPQLPGLCQLEDPEIVLGRLAQSRWADERAAATGMSPQEAQRAGEAFSGAAADRRARELSRIGAVLKREVARGARRSTSACTPYGRTWRTTRSARRPSRAPGAGTSGRAGWSSPSAAKRAARRAPRPRRTTAATRP